jgi:basic membrane lipoprotein Med (substrate-binding protein (PBP1-ABC) superfamily)
MFTQISKIGSNKILLLALTLMLILALMLSGCQPEAPAEPEAEAAEVEAPAEPEAEAAEVEAPAEPEAESAPAEAAEEPVEESMEAEVPTELKISIISQNYIDAPWLSILIKSMERIVAEKPHGLTITYEVSEGVPYPDTERVMRQVAASGDVDIIWGHSAYKDEVSVLREEYPDYLWVISGAGNEPLGGSAYWVDMDLHEATYLLGIMAGMLTESNSIGIVADYPYPNVNTVVNGFVDGVKAVNPDADLTATFIESWFDPPKAKEAADAQIAIGVDQIFAPTVGPFEACAENDIICYGLYEDQNYMSPEVVLSSAVLLWDPHISYVIDAWWENQANGVPYDAPMEAITFGLKEGGADIASYHDLESTVPQEVKDAVEETKQAILDGSLVIPLNPAQFEEN